MPFIRASSSIRSFVLMLLAAPLAAVAADDAASPQGFSVAVLPFAADAKKTVTLSSFRGKKPVALIFGSYT